MRLATDLSGTNLGQANLQGAD
ncbi:pentapeptide repeat-containing protein [Synechococcus sp. PCC 7336]